MDISKLKWIKNVNHQEGKGKPWAYKDEGEIFLLHWHEDKVNAQLPCKGDLMLLFQQNKVTYIVEFLDDDFIDEGVWKIYRKVEFICRPPKEFDWKRLPDQKELFGYDSNYIVGDGNAHSLDDNSKMPKFHEIWDPKGGLPAFQERVHEYVKREKFICRGLTPLNPPS
jgi:hypothetical protein